MTNAATFNPQPFEISELPHPHCRACVIVPVRNEESTLAATLDALAAQEDFAETPLDPRSFEILLLLNNCTDGSADVARIWKAIHPNVALHIVKRTLPPEQANVGTVRRMLMDTAWHRHQAAGVCALLSTDSDSLVAQNWIVRNLAALNNGADAVGGVIALLPGELEALPEGARIAYANDRRFLRLIAELEDLLDPQPGDPWPRHLEHFSASLACTTQAYRRAGGIPHVAMLEDVAFIDALRRVDACIRHDPSVVIYTSARLDGRAEVGLSFQLRLWQQWHDEGMEHRVDSAQFLEHRFRTLHRLRVLYQSTGAVADFSNEWNMRLQQTRTCVDSEARFLAEIDCNRLIDETFRGERESSVVQANHDLQAAITDVRMHRQGAVLSAR